jgi:choline dehydrogenase
MGFDVVVVGGGTAGCVLAARLSENADRRVCLVEAGPDYGPLADGRWPAEILDASELAFTHAWEPGADDGRTLGGRILGGSSAMNACMVLAGSPDDYDEWGGRWSYAELRPFLERAARAFRTRPWTDEPTPFQTAFLDAATKAGHVHLADPNDPASPVGVAPAPRNVHQSRRWNAAFAFLEDARQRPNLTIVPDTLVDRVLLDGTTATGVATSDGQRIEAPVVFLAAGAYFSPAILMRSGIGPARALEALGIGVVEDLPVGERLLDHCGTDVSFDLSPVGAERVADHARVTGAFGVHAVVKAASSACEPGSWDLHLVPWVSATDREGEFRATIIVFHMKPLSSGSVRLGSTDANELPVADRGFLTREEDLVPLLEGIELAREIAATEPLASMLGAELLPGDRDGVAYIRETIRNYFHPAGTCPLGTVVDTHARVFGIDGLYVADASFMPTIPRANTNLTTAAIAERIAAEFA